jgi:hypothetical protein
MLWHKRQRGEEKNLRGEWDERQKREGFISCRGTNVRRNLKRREG